MPVPTGKAAHHHLELIPLRRTKRAVETIRARVNTITSIKNCMASLQKGLAESGGTESILRQAIEE
jgi:hypothetical protein